MEYIITFLISVLASVIVMNKKTPEGATSGVFVLPYGQ